MNKTKFESWTGKKMFGASMVIEAVPTEQLLNFIKNFKTHVRDGIGFHLASAIAENEEKFFMRYFNNHRQDFDNVTNELIRRANSAISDDSDSDSNTTSVSDEVSTDSGAEESDG